MIDHANRNKLVFRLATIVLVFFLVYFREPMLFTHPRFWAEEGAVYFANAYNHPGGGSLFSIQLGYYSLINNLSALLAATAVPLARAPEVSIWASALVQVSTASSLLFLESPYWNTNTKKLALVTGMLLLSPAETWLNTINQQFWLTIGTFIILLARPPASRLLRLICYAYLTLAFLSGVVALFLAPIFLLKWHEIRDRHQAVLLAITVVLGAIELAAVLSSFIHGTTGNRFAVAFLGNVPQGILRNLTLPFAKINLAGVAGHITSIALIILLCRKAQRDRSHRDIYLAISCLALLTTLGSLKMAGGDRYAFASAFMILVLMVHWAFSERNTLARAALALVLGSHALVFPTSMRGFFEPEWPVWAEEINRSSASNTPREIPIHPQWRKKKWSLTLDQ